MKNSTIVLITAYLVGGLQLFRLGLGDYDPDCITILIWCIWASILAKKKDKLNDRFRD